MGFVRRNIQIEDYLDSIDVNWKHMSDSEYKKILSTLDLFIDTDDYFSLAGDEAFSELEKNLPLTGYVFSAPKHKSFSIYEDGCENLTFGYSIDNLNKLHREQLNNIECVLTNKGLTFAYVFNHEWQSMCPEVYIEKNV